MNILNTRRAPTSATPTETDVGRSLWGGYTCRERRGDAARPRPARRRTAGDRSARSG